MQVIDWLAGAGHRLSTGAPNASGTLRVLSGGTNTPVPVFDAAGVALTQPIELDAAGRATVYVEGSVDLAFEDADGAPAGTLAFGSLHDATSVLVQNAGFTGTDDHGTAIAGGSTTLDHVLTKALASFGGTDWMVQESASGTARALADTLFGIQLPVKGFGAKGDGLTDDTSAIQLAINRCAARGGGVVYFDPGTYLISSPLTMTSVNGVSIRGAGPVSSAIKNTNTTANAITITSCFGFSISGIGITHSSDSTQSAIQLASCGALSGPLLIDSVSIQHHTTGLNLTGTSGYLTLSNSSITAASRSVQLNSNGSAAIAIKATSNYLTGAVEFSLSSTGHFFYGNFFTGSPALTINAAFSGSSIVVQGNYFSVGSTFTCGVATEPAGLRVKDNYNLSGTSVNAVSGATITPDRMAGENLRIRGATTGSAYTINAPTPVPASVSNGYDIFYRISFFNNAGGAITGWTLNAAYHVSSGPSTTDGQITSYIFKWDPDASVWREYSRSVTT